MKTMPLAPRVRTLTLTFTPQCARSTLHILDSTRSAIQARLRDPEQANAIPPPVREELRAHLANTAELIDLLAGYVR